MPEAEDRLTDILEVAHRWQLAPNAARARHLVLVLLTFMLRSGLPSVASEEPNPPIPVQFRLEQPGFVTLVIDDGQGKRVRNLISQDHFPAGTHTVWWDGLDDRARPACHSAWSA